MMFMSTLAFTLDYIIPFLIVLTVLVFIHELGHYLVARYNGVKVEVFSIGFGPKLFGWMDGAGTQWKVSAIPLGGYVKMLGDADASSRPDTEALQEMAAEDRSKTLHSKTVGQRMAVSVAGPLANFILAIVLMAGVFAIKGEPFLPAVVGSTLTGKLADKMGLKAEDRIASINGKAVNDFMELRNIIQESAGKDLTLSVVRKGETLSFSTKMEEVDEKTGEKKPISQLGIGRPAVPEYKHHNLLSAIGHSFTFTYTMCVDTVHNLGQMIMGKRSSEELGGILAIGDMAGQSAKGGIVALIWFMALLSVNLGLINLFPVPVLDGGHLVFYAIEWVRGKPVSEKAQEYAFLIGLVVVLSVMAMSTWNDLVRYKILHWFGF